MKSFITVIVVVFLLAPAAGSPDQGGGQSGATSSTQGGGGGGGSQGSGADPTPFEQFVAKLKLDKKQLPEVEKLFTAAATEAAPIAQELIRLRTSMIAADGKPDELAPLKAAYTTAAARMAASEVRAYRKVQALLNPGQMAKTAEAFPFMAGLFNPPTPRASNSFRRGGL